MPLPIKVVNEMNYLSRIVNKEDILSHLEDYQDIISYYRWYPDALVDLYVQVSGPDCTFQLYAYQRIMLRALARYPNVYLTFSRGTAKTFTNVLWQFIKCILYPNTKAAVCATTKQQSGKLLSQKTDELLALIPALRFELKKNPVKVKDDITVFFKNGSWIMNVAAKGSTRGDRQCSLSEEELIEADPQAMESVVRPLLAIRRLAANGLRDPNERQGRTEAVMTTAGVNYYGVAV